MKKHYIDIVGKWSFVFAYDIEENNLGEVGEWLEALGAEKREIFRAQDVLSRQNTGLTFTSPSQRMSVVCIGQQTDIAQWWNTLVHELEHLKNAITRYYDVEKDSEEEAYLLGYIMQKVIHALEADGFSERNYENET